MIRQPSSIAVALILTVLSGSALAANVYDEDWDERFLLEVEAGPVWQSRNNVEIPNDGTATRFSLKDLVGTGPWASARVYLTWNVSPRHGIRFLAAPLSYTETGTFATPVTFVDRTFAADVPTEATYQFNSWRIGYQYRFHQGKRWRWHIGLTAKIRDAKIKLSQTAVGTTEDTDVGFVPLLHLAGEYRFAKRWRFLVDIEALGGGPGRAEDVSLKVGADVGKGWTVTLGYRTVEGGADVDEVYNFAWFNYAVVSGRYRWGSTER